MTSDIAPEVVGLYDDDPRDGDQFEAPEGQALGPVHPLDDLPEDRLKDGEQFDFNDPDVVDNFEAKVIRRQVPGYDVMRLRCLQIGYQFPSPGTAVLDLGTSRGKMIRDLITVANEKNRPGRIPGTRNGVVYVGVDTEQSMLDAARASVNELGSRLGIPAEQMNEGVILQNFDLRNGIPDVNGYGEGYSLVTSILTLQFVPIEYRQQIIASIYRDLVPGGAFVWVEKVLGNSATTDDLFTEAYYDHKRRNGISEEAITKKRASIERFLVPQHSHTNRYMLEQAGFKPYLTDVFWRDLQFEGYIAIKEG